MAAHIPRLNLGGEPGAVRSPAFPIYAPLVHHAQENVANRRWLPAELGVEVTNMYTRAALERSPYLKRFEAHAMGQ